MDEKPVGRADSGGIYVSPTAWRLPPPELPADATSCRQTGFFCCISLSVCHGWHSGFRTWLREDRAEAVLHPVETSGEAGTVRWKAVLLTVLFMLVGASPVILDRTFSPRYTRLEKI